MRSKKQLLGLLRSLRAEGVQSYRETPEGALEVTFSPPAPPAAPAPLAQPAPAPRVERNPHLELRAGLTTMGLKPEAAATVAVALERWT